MNFEQAAIVGLLVCMFIIYALEKFRVEVVAISGLAVAFLLGLVPVQDVFAGFSSPAVITVVEILLIITVLSRTRHQLEGRVRHWIVPQLLRLDVGGALLLDGKFLKRAPNATGFGDTRYAYFRPHHDILMQRARQTQGWSGRAKDGSTACPQTACTMSGCAAAA